MRLRTGPSVVNSDDEQDDAAFTAIVVVGEEVQMKEKAEMVNFAPRTAYKGFAERKDGTDGFE